MSEPLLLSLSRKEFEAVYKAASAGDEAACRELETLWSGYDQIVCFLCDSPIPRAEIFSEVVAEYRDPAKLLVLPLCPRCGPGLWKPVRLARVQRMLRRMWSAASGKQVHFVFAGRR